MEKQKLDEVQRKASGVINEGVRILKDSFREAKRLVKATANATSLHIEKESHVVGIHRDYHRLGVELYNLLGKNPKRAQFEVSETMRDIIKRIKDSEKEIAVSKKKLEHMTVVTEPIPEKKDLGVTSTVPRRRKRSR